jgi:hypothetical protein
VPQYTDTTKPAVTAGIQSAGTVVNTFLPGIGGLVTTGLTALIGLYGYLRSSKNYNTGVALTQEIQTIRNFIQSLPNGATYDAALMQFAQAHQADAGVLNNVIAMLASETSNPDARAAAQGVITTINSLTQSPPPPLASPPPLPLTPALAAPIAAGAPKPV